MERFIQVSRLSESKAWLQEGELRADEMPRLDDISLADGSLLQYRINLERKKEEVTCSGNLAGTLSIACDRCGQPLKLDVDEEFTFKMVPEIILESKNGKEILLFLDFLEIYLPILYLKIQLLLNLLNIFQLQLILAYQ